MVVAMMAAVKKQEEEMGTPTEAIDDLLAESSRSDTTRYDAIRPELYPSDPSRC